MSRSNTIASINNIKLCKYWSTIHLRRIQESITDHITTRSWFALKENSFKNICNGVLNPAWFYRTMLDDEKTSPNMRMYDAHAKHLENFYNVYNYYFIDCHNTINQRIQTLHLAIGYFTQMLMWVSALGKHDVEILAIVCLLMASKLDEIDYNLPSFEYILNHMKKSKFWINYSLRFNKKDYIFYEKLLLKKVNWNLSQITPYHFLQALLSQGVILNHEKRIDVKKQENDFSNIVGSDIESDDEDNEEIKKAIRKPYGSRSKSLK